jgi:hypothetical protein
MSIGKRFFYFLIGSGMGILMVIFLFGDRDIQCNYLPNDRVLYDLRRQQLKLASAAKTFLQEQALPDSVWTWALERGDVDFAASQPRKKPCKIYVIDLKAPDPPLRLTVESCDSVATVQEVERHRPEGP